MVRRLGRGTPPDVGWGEKVIARLLRRRRKRQIAAACHTDAWAADLPAFLDRFPRPDLHRALSHAFERGFKARQSQKQTGISVGGNVHTVCVAGYLGRNDTSP